MNVRSLRERQWCRAAAWSNETKIVVQFSMTYSCQTHVLMAPMACHKCAFMSSRRATTACTQASHTAAQPAGPRSCELPCAAGKSAIHGWGAFAKLPHAAGDMMVEYQGEVVRASVADCRERRLYDTLVGAGTYIFSLNADTQTQVDATRRGEPELMPRILGPQP